jgi:hypothetical protein
MQRSMFPAFALAALMPVSGVVFAADNDLIGQRFSKADTDGDGRINQQQASEHMPRVGKNFARIDADKDGFVTLDDIRQTMSERGG